MNCYSNEVKGRPNGLVRLIVVSGCGQVLSLSFRAGSNVRNGAHSGPFWSRADRSDGSAGKGFALKSPTNQLIAVALFPFCYCDVLLSFFFFFIKTVKSIRREMIAARCDSGAFRQPQPVAATENAVNQWKSMWIYSKLAHQQQCGGTKKFNCSLGGAGSQAENSIVYKLRAGGRKKKKISKKWTLRLPPFMCTAYTISYAALLFCRCRTGGQSMPNLIT